MTKVSINHSTTYRAQSESVLGSRVTVQGILNEMFDALGRYETGKGIKLTNINISTSQESEDWEDDQFLKYKITASYDRSE